MFGFLKKKKVETVFSPLTGRIVPLERVPDPVFAEGMVGVGAAVEPTTGELRACCDGEVIVAVSTGHAIGIRTDGGLEIILHIGIDTVEMKGEGFERVVSAGQKVRRGELLVRFDLGLIRAKGKSVISPIVVTNTGAVARLRLADVGPVKALEDVLFEVELK